MDDIFRLVIIFLSYIMFAVVVGSIVYYFYKEKDCKEEKPSA